MRDGLAILGIVLVAATLVAATLVWIHLAAWAATWWPL